MIVQFPWFLMLLPLAGLPLLAALTGRRNLPAGVARSGAVLLLGLALAGLGWNVQGRPPLVVFLDVSASVPTAERQAFLAWLQTRLASGPPSRSALVVFAEDAHLAVPPTSKGRFASLFNEWVAGGRGARPIPAGENTDIARALRFGRGIFPATSGARWLIATDGLETRGRLLDEMAEARGDGIKADFYPLGLAPPPEVSLETVESTDNVRPGEPLEVRINVRSTIGQELNVRLFREQRLVGEKRLTAAPAALSTASFVDVAPSGGECNYAAVVEAAHDTRGENNRRRRTIRISGKARVLYTAAAPGDRLRTLLERGGRFWEVQCVGDQAGLPADLGSFDAVVLVDRSAASLSANDLGRLERAVADEGAGLLVAGARESFSAGGYRGTSLEKMLPLALDPDPGAARLSIVLALDKSGSMSDETSAGSALGLAREGAIAIARVLRVGDRLGLVVFDIRAKAVRELAPVTDPEGIGRDLATLGSSGGTDFRPALELAGSMLFGDVSSRRLVILISDGRPADRETRAVVERLRAQGVVLSTVGIGTGCDVDLLERMAAWGGGRFQLVQRLRDVPGALEAEARLEDRDGIQERPVRTTWTRAGRAMNIADGGQPPVIGGWVRTGRKATGTILLETESGDPLAASGRFGLGRVAAFASDPRGRWSQQWWTSRFADAFWPALLRTLIRPASRGAELLLDQAPGQVTGLISTAAQNAAGPRWIVSVTRPDGSRVESTAIDSGPGLRRFAFEVSEPGRYRVIARTDPVDVGAPILRSDVHVPCRPEFARIGADLELLQQAASAGGGAIVDPGDAGWDLPADAPSSTDLGSALASAAILLFVASGMMDRRIFRRWFGKRSGSNVATVRR